MESHIKKPDTYLNRVISGNLLVAFLWNLQSIIYKDNWPNLQQTQTPVWDLTPEGKLE